MRDQQPRQDRVYGRLIERYVDWLTENPSRVCYLFYPENKVDELLNIFIRDHCDEFGIAVAYVDRESGEVG